MCGEPFKKKAAIAKLISTDAAMLNAREATQIFGGYGFMNGFPMGWFSRDAKVLEISEGTSEVQRILIARELGLKEAARRRHVRLAAWTPLMNPIWMSRQRRMTPWPPIMPPSWKRV